MTVSNFVESTVKRIAWLFRLLFGLLLKPSLWSVAFRQLFTLGRSGWFRIFPFLPIPGKSFLEFRTLTQYGESKSFPEVKDVIIWLSWVSKFRKKSG